jgi:hypothetical protein
MEMKPTPISSWPSKAPVFSAFPIASKKPVASMSQLVPRSRSFTRNSVRGQLRTVVPGDMVHRVLADYRLASGPLNTNGKRIAIIAWPRVDDHVHLFL